MIGRVVGNYKILEKLGEGGMGAVFKGVDVMVEREVAIKMLRPEIARQPEIVERFRSEAVTLAKLNHPSIATLFSFFRQGDEFFMVMEFVPGRPLDTLLRDFGPMPVEQTVPVFVKILEGIEHAHQMGILHRDIKPANIMITPAGAVKVTDFGIARIVGAARMTRQGNIVGTLEYIAPERIRGEEHDMRSDLYSLGAVLYEMLCGRLPFETDNEFALMQAHLSTPPPPLNRPGLMVPPEIEAVAMRALAKRAEERFSCAAEFSQALQAAWAAWAARAPKATRLASPAPPVAPTRMATAPLPAPAPRPAGGKPAWALWVAAAIVIVLMAATGAWFAYSKRQMAGGPGLGQTGGAAPVSRPADPGIPAPGEIPGGGQKTPAQEILKNSMPLPVTAQPKPGGKDTEMKAAPAAMSAEEKRRAALRALEGGSDTAAAEEKERERKRQEALKALQR
jgi:tRNA A-37 threonylcarbamoyl transferase component Bud32